MSSSKANSEARWLPLESNPDVINKYVQNLGVSTDKFEFIDIYGLDSELLEIVPRPVIAVLLLFPITKEYSEFRARQSQEAKNQQISPNVFYTKQYVQNACGTVGLIHALANNRHLLEIDDEKAFAKYLQATQGMSAEQSAEYLKTDESISCAHSESAHDGQTAAPSLETDVDLHFIAFVHKDGCLYELDGAKDAPINHGPCAQDILEATSEVVKKLMALNPNENRFNLIGLAPRQN